MGSFTAALVGAELLMLFFNLTYNLMESKLLFR